MPWGGESLVVQTMASFSARCLFPNLMSLCFLSCCLASSRLLCLKLSFMLFPSFLPPSYCCCVTAHRCSSSSERADQFQGKRWGGLARSLEGKRSRKRQEPRGKKSMQHCLAVNTAGAAQQAEHCPILLHCSLQISAGKSHPNDKSNMIALPKTEGAKGDKLQGRNDAH